MGRPSAMQKDTTVYWVIRLYDSANELVDADSTPTVAVRKNGSSTADVVTVTKRAATTGIYDCSYNPASEVSGDQFTIEESATISATDYSQSWEMLVVEEMRGTDSANTATPLDAAATAAAVWDAAVASYTVNGSFGDSLLIKQGSNRNVSVDSNHNVHAAVHVMEPDVITAAALAASAVTEIQTGLITTGTAFTHTNQAGDTMTVTIT